MNQSQSVRIRRTDEGVSLPEYKTPGAVAFDLAARERVALPPQSVGYVPLNISIAVPEGYVLILAARSSLHKRGLMLANGIGVIDQDFCGNNDELKAAVFNFSMSEVVVEKGERTVQGMIVPVARAEWQEVDDLGTPDRGGFGTTGKH